jgi:hypothetical protein
MVEIQSLQIAIEREEDGRFLASAASAVGATFHCQRGGG